MFEGLLRCRLTSPRLVRHRINAGVVIMRVVDIVRKDINMIIRVDSGLFVFIFWKTSLKVVLISDTIILFLFLFFMG